MRFAVIAAAAATAGVASAHYGHDEPQGYPEKGNGTAPVYTTEVVTAFTTYCPEATTLTHGPETYTVSEATTLTITNCPGGCTVTKPVTSSVVTVCPTCSTAGPIETTKSEMPPAYTSATEEGPKETTSEMAPTAYPTTGAETTYTYPILSSTEVSPVPLPSPTSVSINGTIPATGTGSPVTSGTSTGSPIASYTGAANKAYSAAGAGFLAIFGLVAAL